MARDEKDTRLQRDADRKAYQRRKEVQQMQLLQICGRQAPVLSTSGGEQVSEVASS